MKFLRASIPVSRPRSRQVKPLPLLLPAGGRGGDDGGGRVVVELVQSPRHVNLHTHTHTHKRPGGPQHPPPGQRRRVVEVFSD